MYLNLEFECKSKLIKKLQKIQKSFETVLVANLICLICRRDVDSVVSNLISTMSTYLCRLDTNLITHLFVRQNACSTDRTRFRQTFDRSLQLIVTTKDEMD